MNILKVILIALGVFPFAAMAGDPPAEQVRWLVEAQKLSEQGRAAEAIVQLESRVAEESVHPAVSLELARLLHEGRRPVEALDRLEKALLKHPGERRLRRFAGSLCYELQRYADAATHWALGLDPDMPARDDYRALGSALILAGRPLAALQAYRQGLLYFSADLELYRGVIQCLAELELPAEARAACREALRLHPGQKDLLRLLAGVHLTLGEVSRAIEVLEMFLLLNPGEREVRLQLVDLYLNQSMHREVLAHARRVGEPVPDSWSRRVAQAHLLAGEPGQALKILDSAVVSDAEEQRQRDPLRARAMLELERFDEAAQILKTIAEATLEPRAFLDWGIAELQGGRLEEARAAFDRARRFESTRLSALRSLTQIAVRAGDGIAARELAREALKLDPEDTYLMKVFQYYRPGQHGVR